jgi:hypothetical protein
MNGTPLRSILVLAVAIVAMLAFALPAAAQPVDQEGLVNVNVGDVTVQLPVAVAANVCDVNVNVLARQLRGGGATCDAAAESDAEDGGSDSGPVTQNGLVNVNLGDVTAQVPIGIAANVCDVNANVLAEQVRLGGATCDASALADATA